MGKSDSLNKLHSSLLGSNDDSAIPNVRRLADAALVSKPQKSQNKAVFFWPSVVSVSDCVRFMAMSRLYARPNELDYEAVRRMQRGVDANAVLQGLLQDDLYGAWKCRGCGNIHYQNIDYVHHVEKFAKETKDKYLVNTLRSIASTSKEPVKKPQKRCSICNGDFWLYEEWRVIAFGGLLSGRVDAIFGEGKDRIIFDFKHVQEHILNLVVSDRYAGAKHYRTQLGVYMQEMKVKKGVVYYESLIQNRLKDFYDIFDISEVKADLREKEKQIKKANTFVQKGKMPPYVEIEACKKCYGKDQCKEIASGEKTRAK